LTTAATKVSGESTTRGGGVSLRAVKLVGDQVEAQRHGFPHGEANHDR